MREGEVTNGVAPTGRHLFLRAFQLALAGWAGCVLLQCLLYLRPAPHGGPFLVEPMRYFGLALYYDLLGVWLISAPFLLFWLVAYRRALSFRWTILLWAQAALLAANLFLSQADHEVMRFLGLRLTPSFLATYGQPAVLSDRLFIDLLLADRGGPLLSLVLLVLAPLLYLWSSRRLIGRPVRRAIPVWLALILIAVPLAAPGNAWRQATGQFRLRKVEPVTIAMAIDLRDGFADFTRPDDFAALAAEHQRAWLVRSTDSGWRFPDPERPYLRVPTAPGGPPERWNIIYLQLETLRGADTGFLRPDRRPSPTPMLDRLAAEPRAAVWTRASSFGMPSINGLFATHCSVAPHSRRFITGFTHARLLCLPEMLRARGWRTEMFNGGDTDWDNSSLWLNRWYDRLWRYPEARQRDRAVFRAATARIRELGRSGRPFWATIVSVTNHTPFHSPEPALNVAGEGSVGERILNTTRYTDDVVGEFLRSIATEPWFSRTILVVAGDHGFSTGEHGEVAGQHNLYRESLWVPLIIAGGHPRLPAGPNDTPASLLDVAPTLADLLGVREANPWQGHSLLAINRGGRLAFGFGGSLLFQAERWSAIRHRDGRYSLFADWLQQRDLASAYPVLAQRLTDQAERAQRLHDHLLRNDLIWR